MLLSSMMSVIIVETKKVQELIFTVNDQFLLSRNVDNHDHHLRC